MGWWLTMEPNPSGFHQSICRILSSMRRSTGATATPEVVLTVCKGISATDDNAWRIFSRWVAGTSTQR